ncbi:MAG: archaeosortase/exosortase family protein [Prevotellaceae bacterium]|jgi:exosortase/archaeosortase family protein|nr:archaeosortase/exosortase family protein [Prevotellaceae bacterium]
MNKLMQRFPEPVRNIACFIIILLCAHFFWKFTVLGDEGHTAVTFFGIDITPPFDFMISQVADSVYGLLQFFGIEAQQIGNRIRFPNGYGTSIIWGCAGIKQMYIFFCLIAFFKGSWKDKLWFIPAGFVVVHLFNIFRIFLITVVIENHQEWFGFLHDFLFKYLFYFIIFMMWVIWNHFFVKKS